MAASEQKVTLMLHLLELEKAEILAEFLYLQSHGGMS